MERRKESPHGQNYSQHQRDHYHLTTSSSGGSSSSAQLRRVLNIMFPSAYIRLYHKPPHTVCSLLSANCWPRSPDRSGRLSQQDLNKDHDDEQYLADTDLQHWTVSTEPSSRASIVTLRDHLNASLVEHQAKPTGLCPIRRAIYDQCFDELIRQVTVACIEQGLLLFRIRNELRATISCYRSAYEAGVRFGMCKAIEAEVRLEKSHSQIFQLEVAQEKFTADSHLRDRISEVELKNKLESVDKLKKYFGGELTKKDQIIEQQRAIIRALSHKFTSEIRSPI